MKMMIKIDQNDLKKSPGINSDITIKIVEKLNTVFKKRNSPLFIYVYPDIERLANELQLDQKELFTTLKYLACRFTQQIEFKAILHVSFDDLEYMLQEEDLEELEAYGTVHNPKNPNIIYKDAQKYIKHAFVINYECK